MPADRKTLAELSRSLQARTITSEAVTDACLARIAERDSSINAFITVLADEARAQARGADEEIAAGRYRGPLHGVPISLKDLIDLRGTPTSAASRVRRGHVAAHDSSNRAATSGSSIAKKYGRGMPSRSPRSWRGVMRAGFDAPSSAWCRMAASSTDRQRGPMWSSVLLSGTTPSVGISPRRGFKPTRPHAADGIRIEPPVSEPIDA